jgi:hypothetical protein
MRLGWLSRLGIVLTAFGLPITAATIAVRQINDVQEAHDASRDLCIKFAKDGPMENYARAYSECWDQRMKMGVERGYHWRLGFGVAAILFSAAWLLGLAVYWSWRWIWAGRRST